MRKRTVATLQPHNPRKMSEETRKYEVVVVLNIRGEEGVDEKVNEVGREFEDEGAKLEKIDKLGKRQFAYNARHQASGYYVNYYFSAAPSAIQKMKARLDLNTEVYLQQYFSA